MISTDQLRGLVTRYEIVPIPAGELSDDTPITLDSLALVWLLHALEEEHGIVADPHNADVATFTSVRGIHDYLARLSSTSDRIRGERHEA